MSSAMKTLIFPDLHEPPEAVLDAIEAVIASEQADRIVFLGDYFDHYYDTPEDARRMAQWLKHSLMDPHRVHLIGNHDAAYFWPSETTFCPGFTFEKAEAIRSVLGEDAHKRFVFHVWVDDWLLTHAGLSAQWAPGGPVAEWLITEERKARVAFAADKPHWFIEVGAIRGGAHPAGGILWCDHRELIAIPGVRQIYGHTPGKQPRWIETHRLCLDTNLGKGPRHFAVVTGGEISVRGID
jgi:hypothetical protein